MMINPWVLNMLLSKDKDKDEGRERDEEEGRDKSEMWEVGIQHGIATVHFETHKK